MFTSNQKNYLLVSPQTRQKLGMIKASSTIHEFTSIARNVIKFLNTHPCRFKLSVGVEKIRFLAFLILRSFNVLLIFSCSHFWSLRPYGRLREESIGVLRISTGARLPAVQHLPPACTFPAHIVSLQTRAHSAQKTSKAK